MEFDNCLKYICFSEPYDEWKQLIVRRIEMKWKREVVLYAMWSCDFVASQKKTCRIADDL